MNIDAQGIQFFIECFKSYWDGKLFLPFLFAAAVVFIFCKKDKVWRNCLGIPFVAGLVSVFNPFLMNLVIHFLGRKERYYRFYWMVPVCIIISIVIADLLYRLKSRLYRALCFLAVCILLICCGNPVIIRNEGWNIYKVDSNAIEISDIIHRDTEQPSVNVFADITLLPNLRQYDASLTTVLGLADLYFFNKTYEEICDIAMSQERYLMLMANYNVEIDAELVNSELIRQNVDYFIRNKGWFSEEYVDSLNLEKIGETSLYEIYKVIL